MTLTDFLNKREIYLESPNLFKNYLNNYRYAELTYYTSSRNIQEAVRMTYRRHWDTKNSTFNTLTALCGYYLDQKIQVKMASENIKADTNLTTILELIPNYNNQILPEINLVYYYVPRGKSFLEEQLKTNCANEARLEPLEQLLKVHDKQYIRIYKDFPTQRFTDNLNNSTKTIIIFTDYIDQNLIANVTMLLPHLLELKEKEEKKEQYAIIMQIFEYLFKIYKGEISDETNSIAPLIELYKQLNELCDYNKINVEKFAKTLSTLRSSKARQIIQNELNITKNDIKNCEERLNDLYERCYKLEQSALQNAIAPIDVSPFMNFIKNAKTIEIINSNEHQLYLRVTAPFQYFREHDLEIREKNSKSDYNILIKNNTRIPEIHKSILHKIFVTREYKLLAQAVIVLSLDTNPNDTRPMYYEVETSLRNYDQMPNPHIFHYNCWEKAKNAMSKALAENKYEVMLAQIVAAVQSINLSEDPSFAHRFMNDWFDEDYTRLVHVIVEDGTILNYKEILEYEANKLKENKTNTLETLQNPEPTNNDTAQTDDIAQRLAALEESAAGSYTQIELPDED